MRTGKIISELLEERQELLVRFCRLTGLEPYSSDQATLRLLGKFCQTLVDYAGLAHFELFEKLAEEAGGQASVRQQARKLYQPLVDNTQALVDFNDRYDASHPEFGLTALAEDLSGLGEMLAARFDLEDRLIRLLREADAA